MAKPLQGIEDPLRRSEGGKTKKSRLITGSSKELKKRTSSEHKRKGGRNVYEG